MSQFTIDQVLAQMRTMKMQAQGLSASGAASASVTQAKPTSGFSSLMQQGIQQVNQTQKSAENLMSSFERGVPGVELPQVMLEMQKANVSFRAVTEVRNRLVNAY